MKEGISVALKVVLFLIGVMFILIGASILF